MLQEIINQYKKIEIFDIKKKEERNKKLQVMMMMISTSRRISHRKPNRDLISLKALHDFGSTPV